ncbi:hypothetical protein [Photobacterium sp. GB-72]|uniref:hypothetical protein n=1 Tax=Photobacterium sp. GB-72 TaxID=2022105 RepID=UPI001E34842D|nr:hypothetical protein [Photobacterium sp. GB-72]
MASGHNKKQLKANQFMFMLAGQLTLPSPNKTVRIKAQPFALLPICHAINGNISTQITDVQ